MQRRSNCRNSDILRLFVIEIIRLRYYKDYDGTRVVTWYDQIQLVLVGSSDFATLLEPGRVRARTRVWVRPS